MKKHLFLQSGLILMAALLHHSFAMADNNQPVVLELKQLAGFKYEGIYQDRDGEQTCHLSVSDIAKDFSGRLYQDYKVWVKDRPAHDYDIRRKGADLTLSPNSFDKKQKIATYQIIINEYVLKILSDWKNPTQIKSFSLIEKDDIAGTEEVLVECQNVSTASPHEQ